MVVYTMLLASLFFEFFGESSNRWDTKTQRNKSKIIVHTALVVTPESGCSVTDICKLKLLGLSL